MPAKAAGFRIVQALRSIAKEADSENAAKIAIFMEGSHLSLSYIWAAAKSLSKPILFYNPPESETVDEEGTALLDQLKGGNEDQGNGRRPNKRGGKKKRSKSRRRTLNRNLEE
jgi:hypothetical protein